MINIRNLKHRFWWMTPAGKRLQRLITRVGVAAMWFARACFRFTYGRCCMCGCRVYMDTITRGGMWCGCCYERYIMAERRAEAAKSGGETKGAGE